MISLKTLAAVLALSTLAATSALAQFSEPAAFEAQHPNRDVLNGGALTPEAQMRAGGTGFAGPAYPNAYAGPRDGDLQVNGVIHRHRLHRRP